VTTIRVFQAGDDAAQVSIYNEAAASLSGFKPATLDEVRRRARDPAFDPRARFLALVDDRPVGYANFQVNGRVSFPWCRPGHEFVAEQLLDHVLETMRARAMPRAWVAYRADWKAQLDFLQGRGFRPHREMINFMLDLADMPTPTSRPNNGVEPLRPEDVPTVLRLGAGVVGTATVAALEKHLLHNPYFNAASVFAVRGRSDSAPIAVGLVVANAAYANPAIIDASMPCFRLGAFGTEGLTTKRVNGLFSFVCSAGPDVNRLGLDLMAHAALRLQKTDVQTFAAQVPSDADHLLRFYNQYLRRQGSFPVLQREL
jgi:hypothetical protein